MTIQKSSLETRRVSSAIILVYIGIAVLGLLLILRANVSVNKKVVAVAVKEEQNTGKQDIVEVKGATPEEEQEIAKIAEEVVPEKGYSVAIKWGGIGKKLVAAGAIDLEKYDKSYSALQDGNDLLSYLKEQKDGGITINKNNARFWVNTLWALGLTQKSDVLDEMKAQYPKVANLAGTGGWTLGTKDAMVLYGSQDIISLTAEQQALVTKISKTVFRPCCNNPTSFPDCNHGMAALGLIEIMVNQNFSEEQIYKALLAFNSYWFSQNYTDLAYYFQKNENTAWSAVDPKTVLSAKYSSSSGYKDIKKQIGSIPGAKTSGAGCGV